MYFPTSPTRRLIVGSVGELVCGFLACKQVLFDRI